MTKGLTKFMLIAVLMAMVLLMTSCAVDKTYSEIGRAHV